MLDQLENQAVAWLKALLSIDTSNPPGYEKEAAELVCKILADNGIVARKLEKDPERPNVFAEIQSSSSNSALLLSSHLDVVPVEEASFWKFPPFSATEHDGMLWARGALDVKFKTALDIAAMLWAKEQNLKRPLKFLALADEEAGCDFGSKFVLSEHFDLVKSEYVLNEVGGFNIFLGTKEIFLIQSGEKSFCQIRLHARGSAMHASTPIKDTCIVVLAKAISALNDIFLGYQLCDSSTKFLQSLARDGNDSLAQLAQGMLRAESVEDALEKIDDLMLRAQLRAMFCHTVSPTRVGGGFKINVIPEAAWVDLDCRLVPGVKGEDFVKALEFFLAQTLGALATQLKLELVAFEPGYEISSEDSFFEQVKLGLEANWVKNEKSICVPYLLPASSDSSHYSRAGIRPIGFSPLRFAKNFPGFSLAHGLNERIPLKAFSEGLRCYLDVLKRLLL